MNLNQLINQLLILQNMGYGDSQVLYDYYGETKSVHVENSDDNKGFYINLCPIDL